VTEQFGDHVEATSGIGGVAAIGGREQLADRVRAHPGTHQGPEQIHQHEVAGGRLRHAHPVEHIRVERLQGEEVQRNSPLPAGVGPCPIGIVVSADHIAGERGRCCDPTQASR
jgi:hypothetical protein